MDAGTYIRLRAIARCGGAFSAQAMNLCASQRRSAISVRIRAPARHYSAAARGNTRHRNIEGCEVGAFELQSRILLGAARRVLQARAIRLDELTCPTELREELLGIHSDLSRHLDPGPCKIWPIPVQRGADPWQIK